MPWEWFPGSTQYSALGNRDMDRRNFIWSSFADDIIDADRRLRYRSVRSRCNVTFHMTAGTVMPMAASMRTNSRRTTATVVSRNFFLPSSASLRMGKRW